MLSDFTQTGDGRLKKALIKKIDDDPIILNVTFDIFCCHIQEIKHSID